MRSGWAPRLEELESRIATAALGPGLPLIDLDPNALLGLGWETGLETSRTPSGGASSATGDGNPPSRALAANDGPGSLLGSHGPSAFGSTGKAGDLPAPTRPNAGRFLPPATTPSVSDPKILLTSTVLTNLRQQATNNTAAWQAFKARLDGQLNRVDIAEGTYQGSQLPWISDYALGYQALKISDLVTASHYADKALAFLKSALHDYQKVGEVTRQFLARGDGVNRTFTLPNADLVPSTLTVYLAPVTTRAVTHKHADGQDTVDYYEKFLKVSNTSDGTPDYAEGTDWRHNPDYANNLIDWSATGAEPAVGATYYVTETSSLDSNIKTTRAYTLSGSQITFTTAPAANRAVFVEYLFGTPSADGSTLGYQQTSAGDGGFNSIFVDTTYTSRYLGKHVAMGYDWLYDYAGFSPALKSEAAGLLVRWSDYVRDFGYYHDSVESNYGAGGYVSRMMTAIALSGGRDVNGPRLISEMTAYRKNVVVPQLTGPNPSLAGGFWAEGWNYGNLAAQNILLAAEAYHAAGLGVIGAEQTWSTLVLHALVTEQPTRDTIYDGGDWYGYPAPFPSGNVLDLLAAFTPNATWKAYANYLIQNSANPPTADYVDLLFRDPAASASFWSGLSRDYLASGTGLVTGRADWSYQSTWLSFQLGNLLTADHQTDAPGQLQVQRGPDDLLISPNGYDGPLGPQRSEFSNLIAIDDNGDGLQTYRWNMGFWYGNPGVFLTAYESKSNYLYTAGDYRAAYSPAGDPGSGGPATQLTRQVVYFRPDFIVVHDRAGTVKDTYPKQLQWHFLNPPTVAGNSFTEQVGASKLFGQTFSSVPLTTTVQTVTPNSLPVYRVTTNNANPAFNVTYTTALQTAPTSAAHTAATRSVTSSDGRMEGVQVGSRLALFGVAGPLDPFAGKVEYTVTGTKPVHHLVTDLQPGRTYQVSVDQTVVASLTASSQGTLSFTATPTGTQVIDIT